MWVERMDNRGLFIPEYLRDDRDMMDEAAPRKTTSRRDEILRVSLNLFLEKGYKSTPIDEIAAGVGTSHSNVHYHFRHKEEILRTLFQPSFDRVETLLHRATKRDEVLEGYLEIMLSDRKLATLLGTDLSVRSLPDLEQQAQNLMFGLREKVSENSVDSEEQMRAECALGVLRSGVIAFPQLDAENVRKVTLPAARAVLASR